MDIMAVHDVRRRRHVEYDVPTADLPRLLKGETSNAMTMETMSFFIPLPQPVSEREVIVS
jgi:hypothetical protein